MEKIGFSTGCLYKENLDILKIIDLYISIQANAVELSFADERSLDDFIITPEITEKLKRFDHVSVHAPWHTVNHLSYNNVGAGILYRLKDLIERFPISGIVFHPDKFVDLRILENSGLPVLIENMDKRKDIGIYLEYFAELKRDFDFGFVLDLQHAYEHDSSMKLAEEMVDVMGDRLKQYHISGYNHINPSHSPVFCSKNRIAITDVLKKKNNVPGILEGILTEPIFEMAVLELGFMRKI